MNRLVTNIHIIRCLGTSQFYSHFYIWLPGKRYSFRKKNKKPDHTPVLASLASRVELKTFWLKYFQYLWPPRMELSKGTKTSSVFIGGGFTFGVFCLKLLSQFLSPVLIARMPLLTFAVLDLYEIFKRATFRKIIWLLSALLKKHSWIFKITIAEFCF